MKPAPDRVTLDWMHGTGCRLAAIALLLSGCKEDLASREHEKVAVRTAVIDLQGLRETPLDGRDRIVVLLFVTTECPISNRYAPTIRELWRQFEPAGVAFHLVYPDADDGVEAIGRHLDAYDLALPAWRDPEHELVAAAEVVVTPEAAVFSGDPGSTMMLRYHGRIDDRAIAFGQFRPEPQNHDLRDAMVAVLAGQDVKVPSTKAVGCHIADLR